MRQYCITHGCEVYCQELHMYSLLEATNSLHYGARPGGCRYRWLMLRSVRSHLYISDLSDPSPITPGRFPSMSAVLSVCHHSWFAMLLPERGISCILATQTARPRRRVMDTSRFDLLRQVRDVVTESKRSNDHTDRGCDAAEARTCAIVPIVSRP